MKKIKVILIDDEEPALDLLAFYAQKNPSLELKQRFSNGISALKWLANNHVDLVISDIEMPGLNGLELAKTLPSDTKIIFSTAYDNYAVQGFNLAAVDYLLKPYPAERFNQAISRAVDQIQLDHFKDQIEESIIVKVNYTNRTVYLSEILFIESVNNNLHLHLINDEKLVFRASLKTISEQLPEQKFFRIHRSYIVPRQRITAFNNNRVIVGNKEFPISAPFKNEFLKWMNGGEK